MNRRLRTFVVGCGAAAALCLVPDQSQAFWNWFNCCRRPAVPVVAVPSCNPTQQTVAYVPQVAYRAQYVNVPVTAYRPVTSCDACTGAPVTAMLPVTAYRAQVQMVPYTTYRLVYSGCATGCAAPAATTTYYAPTAVSYAPAAPSCCTPTSYSAGYGAATTTYYAPSPSVATPSYAPSPGVTTPSYGTTPAYPGPPGANGGTSTYVTPSAPQPSTPAPGGSNGSGATVQPSLAPVPQRSSSERPQTYLNEPANGGSNQQPSAPADDSGERLKPIPDDDHNRTSEPTSSGPRLIPPTSSTTRDNVASSWALSRSAASAVPARTASMAFGGPSATATAKPKVDDGGWRPSR